MPASSPGDLDGYLYIDGTSGNDTTGDGGSQAPWKTLTKFFAAATITAATVLNIKNDVLDAAVASAAFANGFRIQQWAGGTAYRLFGWKDFAGSGFTANANTNSIALTGLGHITAASGAIDWDTSVDSSGRHFSHLIPASSLVNCQATANSWWIEPGVTDDTFHVRWGANVAVTGHTVSYSQSARSGLIFTNNFSNGIITDYAACGYCDGTEGQGYGLGINGQNCTVGVRRMDDNGRNHIGFVANGIPCLNNTVTGGTFSGGATLSNFVVFFSDTAGSTGNSGSNMTMYCHTFLGVSGTAPVVAGRSISGCFSHASAGTMSATWTGITCNYWTGEEGGWIHCNNAPTPSDTSDYRTFGVKAIQCTVLNGVTYTPVSHIAYHNCHAEHGKDTLSGSKTFLLTDPAAAATINILWSFSEFIANQTGATFGSTFYAKANGKVRLLNCSWIDITTGNVNRSIFQFKDETGTGVVTCLCAATDSIFSFETTPVGTEALFTYSDGESNSLYSCTVGVTPAKSFSGCHYFGDSQPTYNGTTNTNDKWGGVVNGVVDTTATFPTTSPFATPTVNGSLKPSAAAFITHKAVTGARSSMSGINRVVYRGNAGAWQNLGGTMLRARKGGSRRGTGVR